jgi:hypothetical protein
MRQVMQTYNLQDVLDRYRGTSLIRNSQLTCEPREEDGVVVGDRDVEEELDRDGVLRAGDACALPDEPNHDKRLVRRPEHLL